MHQAYHPQHAKPKRPVRWWTLLPWLLVAYAATGIYTVQPNERALVQRCGKALPELRRPGLHCGLPYGIDRVTRLKLQEQKRVDVGASRSGRTLGRQVLPAESECLTGDRNLLVVSATVQYRIAGDGRDYLFNTTDVPALVRGAVSSALTSVIASMHVDEILTVKRSYIQTEAATRAREILASYEAGVQIESVLLDPPAAPQEVAEAFRDVTAARADQQTATGEARRYADRVINQARVGEVGEIRHRADADANQIHQKTKGDVSHFNDVVAELSLGNRALTSRRLILETMEETLPRVKKIVLLGGPAQSVDLGLIEAE